MWVAIFSFVIKSLYGCTCDELVYWNSSSVLKVHARAALIYFRSRQPSMC